MTDVAQPDWRLGPFSSPVRILDERAGVTFECPVSRRQVAWAAKDVFNPGAVVHDGKICLLVRAEDDVGRYAGTSRIGLATSADGVRFDLEPEPVLAPGDDLFFFQAEDGRRDYPSVQYGFSATPLGST